MRLARLTLRQAPEHRLDPLEADREVVEAGIEVFLLLLFGGFLRGVAGALCAFDEGGGDGGGHDREEGDALEHHDGGDPITTAHFANFIDGIRNGEKLLHAPISEGAKSTTLMLLSNISWDVQRPIKLEASDNAHIQNDPDAMKLWSREYEKGWAPHL